MKITFVGGPCDGQQITGDLRVGDVIHMPVNPNVPLRPEEHPTADYRIQLVEDRWEGVYDSNYPNTGPGKHL